MSKYILDDARDPDDETAVGPAPRADVHDYVVIVSHEKGVSTISVGAGAELLVGRETSATLRIDDSTVSRRHARLHFGDKIRVEDLGSANGTRVAGMRIAPGRKVEVPAGSVLTFGQVTVLIHEAITTKVPLSVSRVQGLSGPPGAARESGRESASAHGAAAASERAPTDAPVVLAPEMRRIYDLVDRIAPSPISVLILGETGVGKEVLANHLHRRSSVAMGPFVELNCAALPESTLEAELFGYERGAFTGAVKAKVGLIETADNGTLFLDEIGEMSLAIQAKLLRFLESGEVLRLGAVKSTRVSVRVLAATNRDLRSCIERGQFRTDLFFRLNGISLRIPPLRARREEIVPLAHRLLERAAKKHGRSSVPTLTPEAAATLVAGDWPGNVRELRNTLERALVLSDGKEITAEMLEDGELGTSETLSLRPFAAFATRESATQTSAPAPASTSFPATVAFGPAPAYAAGVTSAPPPSPGVAKAAHGAPTAPSFDDDEADIPLNDQVAALERERVVEALERHHSNQSAAARHLGIARTTLIRRMKRFGLLTK